MPHRNSRPVRLLELARREHGAVEVALFWDRDASMATVVVWNWSAGACLSFDVEATRARHAFTHPYAYAAARGVPDRDVLRAA
jgi:hypothetical protein